MKDSLFVMLLALSRTSNPACRHRHASHLWSPANRHSLVDEITYKKAAEAHDTVTQTAILGPFFRHDAPIRKNGSTITFDTPKDGQVVYMHGIVTDTKTKKPLVNASVDVWQASTNGVFV
jgi:protocatechuate 3,4-dioxygenase beta subunit